jgi:DNA-binding response OmpR family regulator
VSVQVRIQPSEVFRGETTIACPHCMREVDVTVPTVADTLEFTVAPDLAALRERGLTRLEATLFALMQRGLGRWFTTRGLEVLVYNGYQGGSTVKTHICHLRQKIVDWPYRIESRPGLGYRLVDKGVGSR